MLDARDALDAIGHIPDVEIDIAGAALQFARIDAPDHDWQAAQEHLSALARDAVIEARALPSDEVGARAALLARLIAESRRYRGDTETYDDPVNANLIHVIERRRGLPVALGIIWLHCARAIGWGAHGIDFPGHFLIALETADAARSRPPTAQQLVIDVFAGGTALEAANLQALLTHVYGQSTELRPGMLQPMSARRVLLRLQENVRVRRLRHDNVPGALVCTEDMLRIMPDSAALWREAAAMNQRIGRVGAAIRCYTKFLALVPEGDAASRAQAALDGLRSKLN